MTDVELVKSKLDIVDFISEYITLKKAGRSFKANCPFHHEKTPSFVVSPERQSWHCFGACNEGGDALTFLQKWENIEFVEALKLLAARTGVTLSHFTPTETSKLKDTLYEINHLAAEFYHYLFISHTHGKRARNYVKSRQIKDETIRTFLLGYAPNSWDSLLKYLTKKGYSMGDMHIAGLLSKSAQGRYFDRFRGRLMFPLKDPRGNVVGFAGRTIPPDTDKEAKYINTTETPIYIKGNMLYGLDVTREAIKKEKEAVIVEGEFDLLASFQAGVSNVVAIKGSALTEGQVLLLKRYTDQIKLALDSDFAGSEAARRGIEIADSAGLSVHIVELPYGKDPAECVAKSPYLWKDAVEKAIPIYDFVIHSALHKYDKTDVFGKKKIAHEVLPFLSKLSNLIVQSHYVKKLARELDVTEESIVLSLKTIQQKGSFPRNESVQKSPKDRVVLVEEHLLALLLQSTSPNTSFEAVGDLLIHSDFSQPAIAHIWKELSFYIQKHNDIDIKLFGKALGNEYIPLLDRVYMTDIQSILSDDMIFHRELMHTARAVKLMSLRRRINKLATDIQQAEEGGLEKEAVLLQQESKDILFKMHTLEKASTLS